MFVAPSSISNAAEKLNNDLLAAIRESSPVVRIAELIDKGADVNAVDEDGKTALMIVVTNRSYSAEVSTLLINKGANVNVVNGDGKTALMFAIEEDNIEAAENILTFGKELDINLADNGNKTALMLAAVRGKADMVRLLIDRKRSVINVNAVGEDGKTALMFAITDGPLNVDDNSYLECLEVLIEAGADANAITIDNKTVLMIAAEDCDEEVAKILITKGKANVNFNTAYGTAITVAAEAYSKPPFSTHHDYRPSVDAMLITLLNEGANPNAFTRNGETPLIIATKLGRTEVVRTLLFRGADVNMWARDGVTTALTVAQARSEDEYPEITKLLTDAIKTDDDLHPTMPRGKYVSRTKLNTVGNRAEAVTWAEAGAGARVGSGAGAEAWAEVGVVGKRKQYFVKKIDSWESEKDKELDLKLLDLIENPENTENYIANKLEGLIRIGASANADRIDRTTALMIAARRGFYLTVNTLIRNGANILAATDDGMTPLMFAILGYDEFIEQYEENHKKSYERLPYEEKEGFYKEIPCEEGTYEMYKEIPYRKAQKEYGGYLTTFINKEVGNINYAMRDGTTALILAIEMFNMMAIKSLLLNGADITLENENGTALVNMAAQYLHVDPANYYYIDRVLIILLSRGANPNAFTRNGETPLIIATKLGRTEVVRTLLSRGADVNMWARDGVTTALTVAQARSEDEYPEITKLLTDATTRSEGGAAAIAEAGILGGVASTRSPVRQKKDHIAFAEQKTIFRYSLNAPSNKMVEGTLDEVVEKSPGKVVVNASGALYMAGQSPRR